MKFKSIKAILPAGWSIHATETAGCQDKIICLFDEEKQILSCINELDPTIFRFLEAILNSQ